MQWGQNGRPGQDLGTSTTTLTSTLFVLIRTRVIALSFGNTSHLKPSRSRRAAKRFCGVYSLWGISMRGFDDLIVARLLLQKEGLCLSGQVHSQCNSGFYRAL